MKKKTSVILEPLIKPHGKPALWIITEVVYRRVKGEVYIDKPQVISMPESAERASLAFLIGAKFDAKVEYFKQVMDAVTASDQKKVGLADDLLHDKRGS